MIHDGQSHDQPLLLLAQPDDEKAERKHQGLLPTWNNEVDSPRSTSPRRSSSNIVYLDGLRGFAALMVCFEHYHPRWFDANTQPPLYSAFSITKVPFLRILVNGGPPAVFVFFVLSGYVLSRSSLKTFKKGERPYQSLIMATLKRPIRLFLPPVIISFFMPIMMQTRLKPLGLGPPVKDDIYDQIADYFRTMILALDPRGFHGPFIKMCPYDGVVWTLPVEFNGSIMVFGIVALFGTILKPRVRFLAFILTAIFLFYSQGPSEACFLTGMALAQLDVDQIDTPYLQRLSDRTKNILFSALFVVSFYLITLLVTPQDITYGYTESFARGMVKTHTQFVLGLAIGATGITYCVLRTDWLQRFFNRWAYMGRISFAFYLVHVPLQTLFVDRLRIAFGAPLPLMQDPATKGVFQHVLMVPEAGWLGLPLQYLATQVFLLPATFVLARFMTFQVDDRCVALSKAFAVRVMQSAKQYLPWLPIS